MDISESKILLVDDESIVLNYLTTALSMRGCSPLPFDNGDKALAAYLTLRSEGRQPRVAVIDDKLVGSTITGLDLVKKIRERDAECVIILISGSDLSEEVKLSAGLTIDKFMLKPITGEDLMAEIRIAMESRVRAIPVRSNAASASMEKLSNDTYLKTIVLFFLLGLTAWCVSNRIADAHWQGQIEGTLKSDQQHTQQLLKIMKDDVDMSWAYVFLLRDQMKESGLKPLPIPKRPNYSEELEK